MATQLGEPQGPLHQVHKAGRAQRPPTNTAPVSRSDHTLFDPTRHVQLIELIELI
jgi:hypothetical protein